MSRWWRRTNHPPTSSKTIVPPMSRSENARHVVYFVMLIVRLVVGPLRAVWQ